MSLRRNTLRDVTPDAAARRGVGWAQRVVRRQLDTLRRLASAASRVVGQAMRRAAPASLQNPLAGVGALEKAVRLHGKVAWALRLIDALGAKLADDLLRLERGEAPEPILAADASHEAAAVTQPAETKADRKRSEKAERSEGFDRERGDGFGRFLRDDDFSAILKRPTDEVIALICRELGLPEDWPRLAEEAWEADMPVEAWLPSNAMGQGPRSHFADRGAALSGKPPDG